MKKFKKLYIEITNICNLSCDFCPKTKRKPASMNVHDFESLATKLKPFGDYLYLHVKGEPLLHKNLDEILDVCQKLNFKVCITTNGTLIKEKSEILKRHKCVHKIHISLHSLEANDTNLSLDNYILNIVDFIKSAKCITVLRLWNDGTAQKLNKKILDKLKENFDFISDLKVKENVFIENGEKFEWADLQKQAESQTGFCYALRNQVAVLVDGTVVPCCLDNNGDINLGNLHENSLEDILKSEKAISLYNGFSNRKLVEQLCKNCGFVKRFNK
ncbi:MAG: SPASM domain-containing protein [Clostridia bacterium]